MKKYVLVIGCLWMLTLAAAAQVNNYYVNAVSGNDSNDGSTARPWRTINHADSALTLGASGTVVHVAPCPSSTPCYTGFTTLTRSGTASQRITYVSDTRWGAIVKQTTFGTSTATWTMTGNYTTIQDFDLSSGGSEIVNIQCDFCSVNGNHVHDNVGYVDPTDFAYNPSIPGCANSEAGIVTDSGHVHTDTHVIGNVVHDIGWSLPLLIPAGHPNAGQMTPSPVACNFGVGIYMSGPNAVVQNNIVYRILVQALAWNHRPTNMVTSNNLVFNISKPGQNNGHGMIIGVAENCCISNSVVQNNIFRDIFPSGQGQGVDCYSGTWANDFVRNNIMFATQGPATFGCAGGFSVSNNITANPQFVNYNANPSPPTIVNGLITWSDADYNLQAGSPAVGAGITSCASGGISPCVPTIDLIGIARSIPPSIGAIEFGTSATLPPTAPTNLTATVQ